MDILFWERKNGKIFSLSQTSGEDIAVKVIPKSLLGRT